MHHGMLVPSNSVGTDASLVLAEVAPHGNATRLETLQGHVAVEAAGG
jgi:hypothetical protein